VATDSRFLRVLDAVRSTDAELGSYIVCEYATGQSLEVILSQGPLSGLEAGWVIREVADALSGVHSLGLYHRRISPETVIITPTGNVKIVGLLIEAALRPARHPVAPPSQVAGGDAPELVDVLDLGRLLYATLVCRWPGGSAYNLPDAPRVGRRWMTPRQVRAGVSPALDNVCDQILGDPPRHRAPQITDANALVNALTKVLGTADASGDLERRLRQPVPRVGAHQHAPGATPVSTLLDQPTEPNPVFEDDDEPVRPHTAAADASPLRISQPVGASPAAGTGSAGTTVIRTPVPQQHPPHRARPVRPPRRWIALLVMLVVLLSGVGLVAGLVLSNELSAAPAAGPSATPARPPAATPASAVLPITSGRDFDPQGSPNRENPDEVRLAYDGNPGTRWRTVAYIGSPRFGNLKRGVGLVLDLGSAQPVASVQVSLSGNGTDLDLRVPRQDPAGAARPPLGSDRDWQVVADKSGAGRSATLTPEQPVTTRFVLVYLTSLPREGGRYRGGISEVEVRR
jgi:putative peptidoglycan lipid II flippase